VSSLLLDTTFLVDVERGGVDLDEVIADADDVAIAAITLAELLVGVRLASPRRKGPREEYVGDVMESVPIITYDVRVASEHADLLCYVRESGTPSGAHDLIIAATARATHRAVITADREAFSDLPGVVAIAHR